MKKRIYISLVATLLSTGALFGMEKDFSPVFTIVISPKSKQLKTDFEKIANCFAKTIKDLNKLEQKYQSDTGLLPVNLQFKKKLYEDLEKYEKTDKKKFKNLLCRAKEVYPTKKGLQDSEQSPCNDIYGKLDQFLNISLQTRFEIDVSGFPAGDYNKIERRIHVKVSGKIQENTVEVTAHYDNMNITKGKDSVERVSGILYDLQEHLYISFRDILETVLKHKKRLSIIISGTPKNKNPYQKLTMLIYDCFLGEQGLDKWYGQIAAKGIAEEIESLSKKIVSESK